MELESITEKADHLTFVVNSVRGAEGPAERTKVHFSTTPVHESLHRAIAPHVGVAGDLAVRIDRPPDAVTAPESPQVGYLARIEEKRVSSPVAFEIGVTDYLTGVVEPEG